MYTTRMKPLPPRTMLRSLVLLLILTISTGSAADTGLYLEQANAILEKWSARKDTQTSLIAAHQYGRLIGNAAYTDRAIRELARYGLDGERVAEDVPAIMTALTFTDRVSELASTAKSLIQSAPSGGEDEVSDAALLNALLAASWAESA